MASDLYEALGVSKDASTEQIRRAYKKRALETHPDRHPNATPEEKGDLENKFRKVANAYEVLNDPESRREYDRSGVWPPNRNEDAPGRRSDRPSRHRHRHGPNPFFNDQFFNEPFSSNPFSTDPFFSRPYRHFNLSDPFDLFERMFQDSMFGNPIHSSSHRGRSPMDEHPLFQGHRMQSEMNNFMTSMHNNMLGFGGFHSHLGGPSHGVSSSSSQLYMSSTTNGVTHTIKKVRDWDGNETVTKTYPDGRKVVTVNGVEQRSQGHLPSSSRNPPGSRHIHPSDHHHGHLPPPPPYPGPPNDNREHREHHHHRSKHHETRDTPPPVIPPANMFSSYPQPSPNRDYHTAREPKKRWGLF